MDPSLQLDRRTMLLASSAIGIEASGPCVRDLWSQPPTSREPKLVAGICTAYAKGLHADVLFGKILEGWRQDRGPGPNLKLASMYVDQFSQQDMARQMARQYAVPIFDSIEQAITLGGQHVAVDGVISIGEHGDYPYNSKGQQLYPRRRFFEAITDTFAKYKRVVPVFNDKHLGPQWEDAKWMVDRARQLRVPFMAGSSMTVGFRTPAVDVPIGCEIEAVVGIGYSGLDIYGSHALEFLQAHVERRRGAEQGVAWVQALQGKALWKLVDDGTVDGRLLDAALAVTPHQAGTDLRAHPDATLFLFRYLDGLQAAIFMLPSFCSGTAIALRMKGQSQTVATRFDERTEPRHPHFAYLLKAIERMFHSGKTTYPVERTLLTSGILDRALTSLSQNQRRLQTPELAIAYQPVHYPHAPLPSLDSDPLADLPG